MPTTSTPIYSAPHNGILGDASATAGAGQLNQFLGTHPDTPIYQGTSILTPFGTGYVNWFLPLGSQDFDQPFTMSGSSIGRVVVPLLAFGQSADLLVSLCADNSGVPGTLITQTRIPGSWITQLAAVSGVGNPLVPGGPPVSTQLTGNPLALAQFNSLHLSNVTGTNWPYPYVASTAAPSSTYYGGYLIQIGGVAAGAAITNVYTIPYSLAPAPGSLSEAIPQAAFPSTNDGSGKTCVVIDSVTGGPVVVTAGGSTSFGGATNANVYTSSLDTTSGSLSAWSQQTSLPYTLQNQGTCSYNGYVYEIGGTTSGTPLTTVSFAQVSNGQITGWTETTSLPVPMILSYTIAASGFLFVVGGANAALSPYATTWYAPILGDGSLGNWLAGPVLPNAAFNENQTCFANGNSINVPTDGAGSLCSLGVTPNGPAGTWYAANFGGWEFDGYIDQGDGTVTVFGLNATSYNVAQLALTPLISVPLPAAGLTNAATYHIVLQQQGGDLNNALVTHIDHNIFPGDPTMLISSRGAYNWGANTSGYGLPIQIFNNTVGGMPLHTWEDNGARISTLVYSTTPDSRLLGICEATRRAYALNVNTGFQTGISPWTAGGGTAVQSQTQTYEGGYAAQVTPSGSAANVYVQSELLACMPGQSVTVTGWFWFTSAVTSNMSLSVNWFTLGGSLIGPSFNVVSVPAATWSNLANTFTAPSGAYQFTIVPTLSGTPAAGQVFYIGAIHAHYTYTGPQLSCVTQIDYAATFPNSGMWPPLGATQLA